MDEHPCRVAGRVLAAAEAVEAGAPPRDLVAAAHAAETAFDAANATFKRLMWNLALDADAASTPWPPHPDHGAERLAVLAAAAPHLDALEALAASVGVRYRHAKRHAGTDGHSSCG